jgi:PhnB protein
MNTSTMDTIAADIGAIDIPMKGVVPHLAVEGAAKASEFYQKAFGAIELMRLPAEDGVRLMHCALQVNGGTLMLCDCFPEYGGEPHQPSASYIMHLQVDDIDAAFQRAVDAGAEVVKPVELMFWGDRYGMLRDPFGVQWSMGETQPQA